MKVGIIGVGLIGGSTAWALAEQGFPLWLSDRNPDNEHRVKMSKLGTVAPWREWCAAVDMVVVAVPTGEVPGLLAQLVPAMRADAVLVEMSSLKVPLLHALSDASRRVRVLSMHVMAGREVSGFGAASGTLFEGAPAVAIDLPAGVDHELLSWWRKSLGTAPFAIWDAAHHDAAVAWISQLPYLASRALALVVEREAAAALDLAGPGFRDTTRVGQSDFDALAPMLAANRRELSRALLALESTLRGWRECLNRPLDEFSVRGSRVGEEDGDA